MQLYGHQKELEFKCTKETYKDVVLNVKGILNDLVVGGRWTMKKL